MAASLAASEEAVPGPHVKGDVQRRGASCMTRTWQSNGTLVLFVALAMVWVSLKQGHLESSLKAGRQRDDRSYC